MKIIELAKRAVGIKDVENARNGIYISRKLLPSNAKKWHDWATKHGIPGVLAADDMHVTVMWSTEDVMVPLLENAISIEISPTYGARGCFAMFGENEDHLVFTFQDWELYNRHYTLCDLGCMPTWSPYRPHFTIAKVPAGYELPHAALQDAPRFIVLVEETAADIKVKTGAVEKFAGDDSRVITVDDATKAKADEMVKAAGEEMSIIDVYDLADVAKGRVLEGVAKRLASKSWGAEIAKGLVAKPAPTRKRAEKEITVTVTEIPEEITKKLGASYVAKANDEDQIVFGIASIATVKGADHKDLHGDFVTAKALQEFNRSILSGTRAGKFEHSGTACTEVVSGLVLTEDYQKALGIELGFEPYLVEIHVPDAADWAEVKKGAWELSIAGLMWYWEDEAEADAEV